MAHPSRSNEASPALAASHDALLNHVMKSPIDEEPPPSLPNCSVSFTKDSDDVVFEVSMFRDRFNTLELVQLARLRSFVVYCLDWRLRHAAFLPEGTISAYLRFASLNNEVAFDVHASIIPDCKLAASNLFDPKKIIFHRRVQISPVNHAKSAKR